MGHPVQCWERWATRRPTHRDKAAMNGAQPSVWLMIEGTRIDAWPPALSYVVGECAGASHLPECRIQPMARVT